MRWKITIAVVVIIIMDLAVGLVLFLSKTTGVGTFSYKNESIPSGEETMPSSDATGSISAVVTNNEATSGAGEIAEPHSVPLSSLKVFTHSGQVFSDNNYNIADNLGERGYAYTIYCSTYQSDIYGMHYVSYLLPENYESLDFTLALDGNDSMGSTTGKAWLEFFDDSNGTGESIFKTGIYTAGTEPASYSVNIHGVRRLRIQIGSEGSFVSLLSTDPILSK